jgi:hypothetical protein
MRKEELAKLLNGRHDLEEMTKEEEKLAKENDLLVCFGRSDDLLEFRGLIYDEVDAYGTGTASIVLKKDNNVDLMSGCALEEIKDLFEENDLVFNLPIVEIEASYCKEEFPTGWLVKSKIPSASFEIFEDGQVSCKGIIIEKADLMRELLK